MLFENCFILKKIMIVSHFIVHPHSLFISEYNMSQRVCHWTHIRCETTNFFRKKKLLFCRSLTAPVYWTLKSSWFTKCQIYNYSINFWYYKVHWASFDVVYTIKISLIKMFTLKPACEIFYLLSYWKTYCGLFSAIYAWFR